MIAKGSAVSYFGWVVVKLQMRRFTWLTNGSKTTMQLLLSTSGITAFAGCTKRYALHAMEAGLAGHVWSIGELVGLLGA
jgi:hypothetical protein